MAFEKKDKLRLANAILMSEEWKLLKEDLERELAGRVFELHNALKDGETNKTFFNEGFRLGLEYALATPQRILKDNQKFFDKMYERMHNGTAPKS